MLQIALWHVLCQFSVACSPPTPKKKKKKNEGKRKKDISLIEKKVSWYKCSSYALYCSSIVLLFCMCNALAYALSYVWLQDDILPKLMTSTGSYEDLFRKEIAKYDNICEDIAQNLEAQEQLLLQIQVYFFSAPSHSMIYFPSQVIFQKLGPSGLNSDAMLSSCAKSFRLLDVTIYWRMFIFNWYLFLTYQKSWSLSFYSFHAIFYESWKGSSLYSWQGI